MSSENENGENGNTTGSDTTSKSNKLDSKEWYHEQISEGNLIFMCVLEMMELGCCRIPMITR